MATSRTYRKTKRAKLEAETRQRIVDAAIAMHQSKGNAATVSEIARRADVSRVTLYRHFPDEISLLAACTSHYMAAHPLPDLITWSAIDDPVERLKRGLVDTFTYHRQNVRMMTAAEHAVAENPLLAELLEPLVKYWDSAADILSQGFFDDVGTSAPFKPAIALSLSLPTWRQLTMQLGMTEEACVAMFVEMICCLRATSLS